MQHTLVHFFWKEAMAMTLGDRIAQKRKEQSMSQEALGAELGVSRQSIYKWETM